MEVLMQENKNKTNQGARRGGPYQTEGPLDPDTILAAEFEYTAQTVFQANEDRARVTTFYLVTAGSLVAAILGTQAESVQGAFAYWAFAILFGVLTLASVLTLLQLARLRQAWFESALAMNQIKQFYIEQIQRVELVEAFRWRRSTLPAKFKLWSISSLLATQVSLLGGATFGAAVIFAGLAYDCWWWGYAITAGVITFVLQMMMYWRLLRH
jgi:hypothetical protein